MGKKPKSMAALNDKWTPSYTRKPGPGKEKETFRECNILTFDPAQKYYSKVIHRKEVKHSNGQ